MKPDNEASISEHVREAAAHSTPLRIQGGNTRAGLGHDVPGNVLDMADLSGITLYEPGALTIVAQAGTPLATIQQALADEGQVLPFEPMQHTALFKSQGSSTIGGVVAANVSGPRRIQAGACRDSLIGVRFVNGQGDIVKNGGRVMKNVTGYDLVKLMCGTHGTLGVLTEVSFKLLPAPETAATVQLHGLSVDAAIDAMSVALSSPYGVSGAAHVPQSSAGDVSPSALTCLRLEGFGDSVKYRTTELTQLLSRNGMEISVDSDPASVAGAWQSMANVEPLLASATAVASSGNAHDIWRISVKPTDGKRVEQALNAGQANAHLMFDWGGGLVWAAVAPGTNVRRLLADAGSGIDGHATLVVAENNNKTELGVFHPEPAVLARVSQQLRHQFDPANIFNRGRMGSVVADTPTAVSA